MTDQTSGIAPAAPPTQERLLTRYLIYATPDSGATLIHAGDQLASTSEQALRKFFSEPPERSGTFIAISENSCKLRTIKSTVKTTLTEIGAPTFPEPQAEVEDLSLPVEDLVEKES